jgi:hypothetical protein
MECCKNSADARINLEEMSPITCYYMEKGCPVYTMWDKDDANLYELDNLGVLIEYGEKFSGVTKAYQCLDSYVAMTDMNLERLVRRSIHQVLKLYFHVY